MRNTLLSVTVAALLLPAAGAAQDRDTWSWAKPVPAGRSIEIKGVNGSIEASYTSGSEVRVRAEKSARRSDVSEVQLVVLEHADGVTICAVYPSDRDRPNECGRGEEGRNSVRNNDVQVDFHVEVPRGVQLVATTVNGGISAQGLQSDIEANTVNGSIETATTGIVNARTVNGSIEARVGRIDGSEDLHFETVNGAITLDVAGGLDAQVEAGTVTGGIETDFPLTVQGRFGPKRISGTVGRGGRTISLNTVNGSIQLRRAGS